MNSPVRLGVSPSDTSTPTGVLNQRFEALFPRTGTLSCEVCLAPQLFLLVYLHTDVGLPSPQFAAWPGLLATALPSLLCQLLPCCESSSPLLPVSTSPTGLDECFFFNSLVVGLPLSSIFCQFWFFFVFKFVVFLLVV